MFQVNQATAGTADPFLKRKDAKAQRSAHRLGTFSLPLRLRVFALQLHDVRLRFSPRLALDILLAMVMGDAVVPSFRPFRYTGGVDGAGLGSDEL